MEWKYEKTPPKPEDIDAYEQVFGVPLPPEYAALAMRYPGARPSPNRFDTGRRTGCRLKQFLPLSPVEAGHAAQVHGWIRDRLSEGLVPFASDESGNYICFYYLSPAVPPAVVFWNHERPWETEYIASSFRHFLEILY